MDEEACVYYNGGNEDDIEDAGVIKLVQIAEDKAKSE